MTDSHSDREADLHVLGALALELRGDAPVAHTAIAQAAAGELAQGIAADLAGMVEAAAGLELVTVGAHYDPVEMLRPGWPLHRELDQLSARAPGRSGSRVIAFGAHEGRLPGTLAPSPDFAGGPLRVVPFVLGGDASAVAQVGAWCESQLLEHGMAGAGTALCAQDAFGMQVEHARYLTVHDLTAMIALQYDHAGIAPLWPLLEAALLRPGGEEWLDAPPEPLLHYIEGEVRIALFSLPAWQQRYAADIDCHDDDCRELLGRRHRHFEARQRQYAAVLAAHGVPVTFVHCNRDADYRLALS